VTTSPGDSSRAVKARAVEVCSFPEGSADTFVDFDHRLAVAVSKLRDALRDATEKPKFIETFGRRGYRFVGQLQPGDSLSVASKVGTDDTPPASTRSAEPNGTSRK